MFGIVHSGIILCEEFGTKTTSSFVINAQGNLELQYK